MSSKPLVVFDFDGVIVDSFQAALSTVREYQPELNISEDEYRECFEGNIYLSHTPKRFIAVFPGFFDQYLPKMLALPPADGIREVIQSLAESRSLAIISSTDSFVLHEWLKKNNLEHYFQDVLGADVAKGKVEKFEMLFNKYEVSLDQSIFITDTLGDLREAEKVGVPSIAVTYGYHDRMRLEQGKSIAIVDTPQEILSIVNSVKE